MKEEKSKMEDWKQDIDWKLFELMEGELSAEDEAQLLKQIESDDELRESWEKMQLAVAPVPGMTFPDKSKLRKKEHRIVPILSFMTATPMKVAAAVIIVLLASYPVWKFTSPDQGTGSIIDAVDTTTPSARSEHLAEKTIRTPESGFEVEDQVASEGMLPKEQNPPINNNIHEFSLQQPVHVAADQVDREEQPNTAELPNADLRVSPISAPVHFVSSNHAGEAPKRLYRTDSRDLDLKAERAMFNQYDDYNGIRPMIDKSLYALGTPFRNTVIKVDRSQTERPTLIMAYVGQRYQAMAMLELK